MMDVGDAAAIDPTGAVGPTAFQVTGGIWAALQYICQHPAAGDLFSEDLPSDFVLSWVFPWSGRLIARAAPEAKAVVGFFDPAAPDALAKLKAAQVDTTGARLSVKASPIHGEGTFANVDLLPGTAIVQLSFEGDVIPADLRINHSCAANAYIDRNRLVRTLSAVPAGGEITLDYGMTRVAADTTVQIAECKCGAAGGCRRTVTNWTCAPASTVRVHMTGVPASEVIQGDVARFYGLAREKAL
jgi:hypothetical protein